MATGTLPRVKDKELAKLIRTVDKTPGWAVRQTRSNHIQLMAPCGGMVTTGSTTSDHRAVRNTRARLRAMGLLL